MSFSELVRFFDNFPMPLLPLEVDGAISAEKLGGCSRNGLNWSKEAAGTMDNCRCPSAFVVVVHFILSPTAR